MLIDFNNSLQVQAPFVNLIDEIIDLLKNETSPLLQLKWLMSIASIFFLLFNHYYWGEKSQDNCT